MNVPIPRRRQPWGGVWSAAPWDGQRKTAEPVRMPATLASPVVVSAAPLSRRRQAFGQLLQRLPWSGAPIIEVPVQSASDTLFDFPASAVTAEDTTLEVRS